MISLKTEDYICMLASYKLMGIINSEGKVVYIKKSKIISNE